MKREREREREKRERERESERSEIGSKDEKARETDAFTLCL